MKVSIESLMDEVKTVFMLKYEFDMSLMNIDRFTGFFSGCQDFDSEVWLNKSSLKSLFIQKSKIFSLDIDRWNRTGRYSDIWVCYQDFPELKQLFLFWRLFNILRCQKQPIILRQYSCQLLRISIFPFGPWWKKLKLCLQMHFSLNIGISHK